MTFVAPASVAAEADTPASAADAAEAPPAVRRRRRRALADTTFLAITASVPAVFYTRHLGFYLDDHYFLGLMSTSQDQSVGGLFAALTEDPKAQLRPVEYFGLAILYRLFGTNPLPYHVFLATLVPLCAIAVYAVLVQLRLPRHLALATPLLFATAPHYSSDRFWPDAYSPTLSLTLVLVSLYASLRAAASMRYRWLGWMGLAGAAMLLSLFMYEISLPLVALTALYHWIRARRGGTQWRYTALGFTALLGVALVVKLVAAVKLGGESSYAIGYEAGFAHHMGYLLSGAVKLNFGTYGIGLPYVLSWIVDHSFSWSALVAASLVGVAVFSYLARGAGELDLRDQMRLRRRPVWQLLITAGVAMVAVGYSVFLFTTKIFFTSAGIDNRVNIVAALGVALIALGVVLRLLEYVPLARRQTAFAGAVAAIAATGVFITTTIAVFWQEAAQRQRDVLAGLRTTLPAAPGPTTVIVDGVCPEVGPAVVFSVDYDLTGALHTMYRDRAVQGIMAKGPIALHARGFTMTTDIYNRSVQTFYEYDRRMRVYDWRRDSLEPFGSYADARAYLASSPRPQCPPQRVFAWGLRTSRYLPFN